MDEKRKSGTLRIPPPGSRTPTPVGGVREQRAPTAPGVRDARDIYTPKSRELPAPHEFPPDEDLTGQYDGEELARMRARRPTDKRLARLESKYDDLAEVVTETRLEVKETRGEIREMRGELKVLPELVDVLRQREAREHVTFTAKVEVDKAKEHAQVEVEKAAKLDSIDAKKDRRKLLLTIAGAFASGGIVYKLLQHWDVL